VKIAIDTNVLVRMMVNDNSAQKKLALQEMNKATSIAVSVSSLCELVWVLSRFYHFNSATIEHAISTLIETDNVITNRPVVDAGLRMLRAGGDFADGVIAFEGRQLGADEFVSFDKSANKKLVSQNYSARSIA